MNHTKIITINQMPYYRIQNYRNIIKEVSWNKIFNMIITLAILPPTMAILFLCQKIIILLNASILMKVQINTFRNLPHK